MPPIILLLALQSGDALAVHKCVINGEVVFTDVACPAGIEKSEQIEIKPAYTPSDNPPPTFSRESSISDYDRAQAERERERRMEREREDMDRRVEERMKPYYAEQCALYKGYIEDYSAKLRKGCRVSMCENYKERRAKYQRKADEYCAKAR